METNRLWVSFSLGLPHLNKTHFVSVEESSQVGSVNQASIFKSKKKKKDINVHILLPNKCLTSAQKEYLHI